MIRHILLFRWTEASDAESRRRALDALGALVQSVPSIRGLSLSDGLGFGATAYDGLLEVQFDDEDGYRAYVEADAHQEAWKVHLQPVWVDMASIQVAA